MKLTKNQAVLQKVLERAWDDAEFKKELVTNPMVAIETLTGEKLDVPQGKNLVVLDMTTDSTVYLKIPSRDSLESELTEEQLEMVAGGTKGTFIVSCMAGCDGNDPDFPWLGNEIQ